MANRTQVEFLRSPLEIETSLVPTSETKLGNELTQRLSDICKAVGADTYILRANGNNYVGLDLFAVAKLEIAVQNCEFPIDLWLRSEFASHCMRPLCCQNAGRNSGKYCAEAGKIGRYERERHDECTGGRGSPR